MPTLLIHIAIVDFFYNSTNEKILEPIGILKHFDEQEIDDALHKGLSRNGVTFLEGFWRAPKHKLHCIPIYVMHNIEN